MKFVTRNPWFWFLVGFTLVFVLMLLHVRMHAMHPNGTHVVRCSLWDYYLREFSRVRKPKVLSPSGESGLAVIVAQHMISALIGGAVFGLGAFGLKTIARGFASKSPQEP